jgi:ABC-type transport system involved in cytochrome c biogenesis permease component
MGRHEGVDGADDLVFEMGEGAGAIEASLAGTDVAANLSLLAAILLFGFVGAPFAVASAVKISLD